MCQKLQIDRIIITLSRLLSMFMRITVYFGNRNIVQKIAIAHWPISTSTTTTTTTIAIIILLLVLFVTHKKNRISEHLKCFVDVRVHRQHLVASLERENVSPYYMLSHNKAEYDFKRNEEKYKNKTRAHWFKENIQRSQYK